MQDLFDKEHFLEEYYQNSNFQKIQAFDRQFVDKEFNHCTFANCDFHYSVLSGCIFEKCVFIGCDLSLIKIKHSGFLGVKFVDSKLIGINWAQAKKPIDFQFERCNLNDSVFAGQALISTRIYDCTLAGCDFAKTNLRKSVFEKCNLNNSVFVDSVLTSTKFLDCTVVGGNFAEADLGKCVFDAVDLSGTRFLNTNLNFSDFSTARNYQINPNVNKLRKTVFSLPEAVSLLGSFDIILK
jgi:uncharacterized protein YjbI with pentapeptide repeats